MSASAPSANKIYQYVILMFLLYALIYPLISPLLRPLLPDAGVCYYFAYTGHPCPFCGTTRAFRAFYEHGTPLPYHLLVALVCVGVEIMRKIALCVAYIFTPRIPAKILIIDYILTAATIGCAIAAFVL